MGLEFLRRGSGYLIHELRDNFTLKCARLWVNGPDRAFRTWVCQFILYSNVETGGLSSLFGLYSSPRLISRSVRDLNPRALGSELSGATLRAVSGITNRPLWQHS